MRKFGGDWTLKKIEIVLKYAHAYLQIMKKHPWKLMYFDGFAGSGEIKNTNYLNNGAAMQILEIVKPRPFDLYYFVELDKGSNELLEKHIRAKFGDNRNIHIVKDDCNKKLIDMAKFLKGEGKNYKVLAFIDPFGMSLKWESIKNLKGLGIDLWILIPTGIGANRLLKKDGNIPDSWLNKLEMFLGTPKTEIKKQFYRKKNQLNIFGIDEYEKEKDAISKLHEIYCEKLSQIFNFVSDSFVLKNRTNSIMFHFLRVSNNLTAIKIANDIIKPYKL